MERAAISSRYQKKTQLEHIMLRPDTYIGSTEKITHSMWVFDEASERLVHRPVTYVPGLYKIFDGECSAVCGGCAESSRRR